VDDDVDPVHLPDPMEILERRDVGAHIVRVVPDPQIRADDLVPLSLRSFVR
jgi:hypothetical protein